MTFATTPEPPYYAVIFSSTRTTILEGYDDMSDHMEKLALSQLGCLGAESARGADGFGITVSYWQNEEVMTSWKNNAKHLVAQALGKAKWYEHYEVRIAKVERAYSKKQEGE